jgi:hypothetical protein
MKIDPIDPVRQPQLKLGSLLVRFQSKASPPNHKACGVDEMTTLRRHPYWGIKPEELHEARRRAHEERAKVVRQLFAALVSWRREASDRRATSGSTLKFAHEH